MEILSYMAGLVLTNLMYAGITVRSIVGIDEIKPTPLTTN